MTDMDKMMIETDVAVAQIDRLAAAALVKWQIGTGLPFFHSGMPERILEGAWDNHPVVQAFARHRVTAYNPDDRLREAWQPIETAWRVGDQRIIVTDGAEVHGAAWWHSGEEAWLDCGGITPTHWQPLPEPPAYEYPADAQPYSGEVNRG